MAHKVRYKFNGVAKEINFSYSRYQNMHEAVADAEGIDLTQFLQTEQQLASISKDKKTVRNFRDAEFIKMGFSDLYFLKNGQE
ncbi:DUF2960 domain-containing protein [Alteromonas sp. KS69]|jgi:hypothetical protein|uniref:DUF2960 domain-containing protein n=1 Tax=Alteromonas naphthalenivorans TaxID=715451 RepID=F5Z5X8_ALTNA|nr:MULTISPECIES: DUF2960 family protein [Alteromonas]MBB66690.1 DUF2960 domain-containing protein [Rickettsiales bacterium]AEF05211.1 hypothetical protein ambt_18590 [Alteromonas naphthalenivorans]MBO7921868.1 DUF2960 domain-containing protein [Alteromonas sp. K632G]MCQ8848092.1 DUF2960 domain-containing protein [Alteromonas stellipolaris]RUP80844.1 DUF2960 domain-containing protein [Alteromonas sp. KS69]|tara:strand:+ start:67 stop:315 length:249 start_codon:yes stop_codon:yes gene_type:complete